MKARGAALMAQDWAGVNKARDALDADIKANFEQYRTPTSVFITFNEEDGKKLALERGSIRGSEKEPHEYFN